MVFVVLVSLLLAICAVGWGHGFWSLVRKLSNNPINELPLGVLGFLGRTTSLRPSVLHCPFSC